MATAVPPAPVTAAGFHQRWKNEKRGECVEWLDMGNSFQKNIQMLLNSIHSEREKASRQKTNLIIVYSNWRRGWFQRMLSEPKVQRKCNLAAT
jgi:hypothetical protein